MPLLGDAGKGKDGGNRYRRILAILNPKAGWRIPGFDPRHALEKALERYDGAHAIRETGGEDDARRWAAAAADEGYDLLIVAGGDGTIREALDGLMTAGAKIPLAPVPTGTANLLALGIGVPLYPKWALDKLLEGREVPFDVGRVVGADRYYLIAAGLGLFAQYIVDTPRDVKARLGFLAYVGAGIRNLFRIRINRVEMKVDDRWRVYRASSVVIVNSHVSAPLEAILAMSVTPHDGLLDIVVTPVPTITGRLKVLSRRLAFRRHDLALRKEDFQLIRHERGRRVRVETKPPMPVHIDGDLIGETPFETEVIPGGVRLLVPSGYRFGDGGRKG
ncbi:MAG: diacylglycerol kinase family lipid kinase [Candidatus Eisenbacteria bacterium]|nr:diacylglycerol kinase family lipid kinase [Candidatus Eisenbacteria bacterium]